MNNQKKHQKILEKNIQLSKGYYLKHIPSEKLPKFQTNNKIYFYTSEQFTKNTQKYSIPIKNDLEKYYHLNTMNFTLQTFLKEINSHHSLNNFQFFETKREKITGRGVKRDTPKKKRGRPKLNYKPDNSYLKEISGRKKKNIEFQDILSLQESHESDTINISAQTTSNSTCLDKITIKKQKQQRKFIILQQTLKQSYKQIQKLEKKELQLKQTKIQGMFQDIIDLYDKVIKIEENDSVKNYLSQLKNNTSQHFQSIKDQKTQSLTQEDSQDSLIIQNILKSTMEEVNQIEESISLQDYTEKKPKKLKEIASQKQQSHQKILENPPSISPSLSIKEEEDNCSTSKTQRKNSIKSTPQKKQKIQSQQQQIDPKVQACPSQSNSSSVRDLPTLQNSPQF